MKLYPAVRGVNFGKTTVLPDDLLVVGALVVAVAFFVVAVGALVVADPEP